MHRFSTLVKLFNVASESVSLELNPSLKTNVESATTIPDNNGFPRSVTSGLASSRTSFVDSTSTLLAQSSSNPESFTTSNHPSFKTSVKSATPNGYEFPQSYISGVALSRTSFVDLMSTPHVQTSPYPEPSTTSNHSSSIQKTTWSLPNNSSMRTIYYLGWYSKLLVLQTV